ncbi:MAG: ferredoxin [Myxococcota bacterium]
MTRAALEIRIDRTACQGAQACARHAPGTFSLGSDGKSRAADAPREDDARIRAAAQACPFFAIEVLPRSAPAAGP